MDRQGYEQLTEILAPWAYSVEPKPAEGEDVAYFDVVSDGGVITPSSVLNAIEKAGNNLQTVEPELLAAQPHCLTFEDLNTTQ